MPEVQAAIGRIQLRKLADWTARRANHARTLIDALSSFEGAVRVPQPDGQDVHAWYRLYAYVRPEGLRSDWSRDATDADFSWDAILAVDDRTKGLMTARP